MGTSLIGPPRKLFNATRHNSILYGKHQLDNIIKSSLALPYHNNSLIMMKFIRPLALVAIASSMPLAASVKVGDKVRKKLVAGIT